MAGLTDWLKDPEDTDESDEDKKQKEIKRKADQAAAQYTADTGETPPEEEGVHEDSFVPNADYELHKAGYKQGTIPFGPGSSSILASETTPTDAGLGFIQRLRKMGMPEARIQEAAEEVRMTGHTSFTDPEGNFQTIGQNSMEGRDMKDFAKANINEREANSPGFKYVSKRGRR